MLRAVDWDSRSKGLLWYESTTDLFEALLIGLKTPITDGRWWRIRSDLVFLCLLEMAALVDGIPGEGTVVDSLISRNLERVMPHVRDMALAMRRRDRHGAFNAGMVALERLRISRAK